MLRPLPGAWFGSQLEFTLSFMIDAVPADMKPPRTILNLKSLFAMQISRSPLQLCSIALVAACLLWGINARAAHHASGHAAANVQAAGLDISQLTIMPTRPGQPNGAAFLSIANQGKAADQLIGFSVAPQVAQRGELHTMKHENGMMMMREVSGFGLPAGQTMTLKPGGDHLMLIGIQKPLEAGQKIPATLVFEKAGKVNVIFTVTPAATPAGGSMGGTMGNHRHH
jgi:periplasmic copper chaperone A